MNLRATLFDRAALTMRNLALSALVVVSLSPHEVVGPSFQMSFAATAALVGAYAAWSDFRGSRPGPKGPQRALPGLLARRALLAALGLAATSLVAGSATAIYAAYHFQQMPAFGLLTNLTAMPLVSILVMPFAVLGMLTMPFGLDGPFFEVMGLGLSGTIAIARWFSERSPLDTVGAVAPAGLVLFTIALLMASVATTWLRSLAIPAALAGLLALDGGRPADLLISEDARLLGLSLGEGKVAVNRARPSAFTIENWERALMAEELVKPRLVEDPSGVGAGAALLPPSHDAAGFSCAQASCVARHGSGAVVAVVENAEAAEAFCKSAEVIVTADAVAGQRCKGERALIIDRRELAWHGSAAVKFEALGASEASAAGSDAGRLRIEVSYAVSSPYRPWHVHRKFSREARGLAPRRSLAERPATTPNPEAQPSAPPAHREKRSG